MEEKVPLRAREVKYLWHLKFSQGVNVLPGLIEATQPVPRPAKLMALRWFVEMVYFYNTLIPDFSKMTTSVHGLEEQRC
jgi:hypothetical protein